MAKINKVLAGMQDLLTKRGVTQQLRGGQQVGVNGIDVPFAVDTTEEMQALDVERFTHARVYTGTTTYIDYIYDATRFDGTPSNTGPGTWIVASGSGGSGGIGIVEEQKELIAGQTIVVFETINCNVAAFYVCSENADRGRLCKPDDYSVLNARQIQLVESYPAGTKIQGIVNEPTEEGSQITEIVFPTVRDMQIAPSLTEGARVITMGYYIKGDGGGETYLIGTDTKGVPLDNGLFAIRQLDYLSTKQFSPYRQRVVDFYQQYQHIITDNDDEAIITGADPFYDEIFWYAPALASRPDGRTMMCMTMKMQEAGGPNPGDPGQLPIGGGFTRWDIGMKTTDSAARSWADIVNIIEAPSNDYQLVCGGLVYDAARDRFWMSYTSYKGQVGGGFAEQGTDENVSPQIFIAYSDDNGSTWISQNITADVKPDYAYMNWCPPVKGAVLDDGTVCFTMSSYRSKGGDIEISYIYNKPGYTRWFKGEVIAFDEEYPGVGGGETNLFRSETGDLGAVIRTNTGDPILYSEQRIYHRENNLWKFITSYDTVNCKSGIYYCDTRQGFDNNKLLSTAPHGKNSDNVSGRFNINLWDAYTNTVLGKPHKNGELTEECGYSDLDLMKNGVFLAAYQSNSSQIRGAVFTPNCVTEVPTLQMPYIGLRQVEDAGEANALFDMVGGELAFNTDSNEHKIFETGTGLVAIYGNPNELVRQDFSTPQSGILDISAGKLMFFLSGANGSTVGGITAGDFVGDKCYIFVASGSNTSIINESAASSTSIQFQNAGGNTVIQMTGGTTTQNPSYIELTWLGTGIGWHTTTPANA